MMNWKQMQRSKDLAWNRKKHRKGGEPDETEE